MTYDDPNISIQDVLDADFMDGEALLSNPARDLWPLEDPILGVRAFWKAAAAALYARQVQTLAYGFYRLSFAALGSESLEDEASAPMGEGMEVSWEREYPSGSSPRLDDPPFFTLLDFEIDRNPYDVTVCAGRPLEWYHV